MISSSPSLWSPKTCLPHPHAAKHDNTPHTGAFSCSAAPLPFEHHAWCLTKGYNRAGHPKRAYHVPLLLNTTTHPIWVHFHVQQLLSLSKAMPRCKQQKRIQQWTRIQRLKNDMVRSSLISCILLITSIPPPLSPRTLAAC